MASCLEKECIDLSHAPTCQPCNDIVLPPHEYPINEDCCPTVIQKTPNVEEHIQDVTIRYLKPVAAEPGPLIYKPDADRTIAPAPPLIVEGNE